MSDLAPVILFVYERPEHTRRTVESLLTNPEAKNTNLYIYADGPKNNAAAEGVRKTREYIRSITGFQSITIVEHEQNQGLARATIQGVSDVINRTGRVIVLEDDDETSQDFHFIF